MQRVAVVQHTHTLRPAPYLLRARQEISSLRSARVALSHHVVLWGDTGAHCTSLEKELHAQTKLRENVWCVTSRQIRASMPAMQGTRTFAVPHARRRERGGASPSNDWVWAWNNCDAAYLQWFSLPGASSYDFYWFLEWDVVWSGDLGRLVASFHGHPYRHTPIAWDRLPLNYNADCNESHRLSERMPWKVLVRRQYTNVGRNSPKWRDWSLRKEDVLCDGGPTVASTMARARALDACGARSTRLHTGA